MLSLAFYLPHSFSVFLLNVLLLLLLFPGLLPSSAGSLAAAGCLRCRQAQTHYYTRTVCLPYVSLQQKDEPVDRKLAGGRQAGRQAHTQATRRTKLQQPKQDNKYRKNRREAERKWEIGRTSAVGRRLCFVRCRQRVPEEERPNAGRNEPQQNLQPTLCDP